MGFLVLGFVFGLFAASAVAILGGAIWVSATVYVLVGVVVVPFAAVAATAISRVRQRNTAAMKKPLKPGQVWSV